MRILKDASYVKEIKKEKPKIKKKDNEINESFHKSVLRSEITHLNEELSQMENTLNETIIQREEITSKYKEKCIDYKQLQEVLL